ncbi:hypothetical protein RhiirA1_534204 [Rhizophagus irregularis]|uniref:Uncharacterized protein n=1 Tax=Rhizophagus irregularis TaxID=588596 RepID=A0A2N0RYN7_9GLOM|nr:hypothetical protein RhiirA1_534204 [Rhizophagus irregularis]
MCLMCSRELGYRNSLPIGTPMLTAAQKKYNKYWHKVLPLPKNWQKVLAWAEFALMEKQHIPEVRRMLGRSPDLNSIENLWSIVKYNVEKRMPQNIDELKQFMAEEWNKIPDNLNYTLPAEAVYPININLLPLTDNYMMLFYDKTTNGNANGYVKRIAKGPGGHTIEGGRKGDGTKWTFGLSRRFGQNSRSYEWSLDRLLEKEENMSREVIHPSVEPEEVVNVVNNLRNDPQSHNYELTEDDVVEFINEYKEIQYKGAEEIIPQFKPYSSSRIPSKEEVEEFDANNEKMKKRLAKEDKTKRVEIEKPVDRPKKIRATDNEKIS